MIQDDNGEHASKQLNDGEIIYLIKEPGSKWRIRTYEFLQHISAGGSKFCWVEELPEDWKDREFNSPDKAFVFAQQEIDNGRVPTNRQG